MAGDPRPWFKLDQGYLQNPKVAEALVESHAAVILHLWSMAYSKQHMTDGVVPEKVGIRSVGASPADADMLVELGLWHRSGHDCDECDDIPEGKVMVHNYLSHQDSAADVERRSQVRSEAGSRGGKARAKQIAGKPDSKAVANEQQNPSRLDKTREDKKEKTSSPAAPATEFDRFWEACPKKVGKEAARRAYAKAVKSTPPERILAGIQALSAAVEGKDPQFTPHPATWLNAGRWDDEPDRPRPQISPTYAWANAPDPDRSALVDGMFPWERDR